MATPLHQLHIGIDASRAGVAQRTGTERYSYEIIAALAQLDRRNRYTLYTNGLPTTLPPLGPNVALRNLRFPRLWTHARLGPAVVCRPPDVLLVPSHVVPLLHPRASVVTIHDLGYRVFPQAHTFRRRLELELTTRWSVHAARQVIAISAATKRDLVRFYGVPPERVHVVHHGLHPMFQPVENRETVAAARARHNIDANYLLYVGTVQPRKNLARLLDAFALAHQRGDLPANLELVVAGKRGWLTDAIEQRVAAAGIGDQVRFVGYIADADLPALLSGATGFVFPSLYEGFGFPVLEAMACGTPVLTSTTSSLPEVAGDAALLVDPHDTEAIAAGLARLVGDSALRTRLHEQGLRRAAAFTWQRCAHETLAVLEQTASAHLASTNRAVNQE